MTEHCRPDRDRFTLSARTTICLLPLVLQHTVGLGRGSGQPSSGFYTRFDAPVHCKCSGQDRSFLDISAHAPAGHTVGEILCIPLTYKTVVQLLHALVTPALSPSPVSNLHSETLTPLPPPNSIFLVFAIQSLRFGL